MTYTTTRLNTLRCVLAFLLGRAPTQAEMATYHARLFGGSQ